MRTCLIGVWICVGVQCVVLLWLWGAQLPTFFSSLNVVPEEDRNATKREFDEERWWRMQVKERPHPHAGARRGYRGGGWVVDPSIERLEPFDASAHLRQWGDSVCPPFWTAGIEGKEGRVVLDEVREKLKNGVPVDGTLGSRILCMVYTHSENHDSLRSIARTWARQCDGFFAASNLTDHSIGAIDLPHKGPEAYANMWQKIRSMWAYAHEHYRDEFDFYHIGGDDIYVWPENLRAYLLSAEVANYTEHAHIDSVGAWLLAHNGTVETAKPRPMLFGEPSATVGRDIYANGAAGYTLNRAALDLFARKGLLRKRNLREACEDVVIGSFFSSVGVPVTNTLDPAGRMRYWPQALGVEWTSWRLRDRLWEMFKIHVPRGIRGVSDQPVGCHLKHMKKKWQLRNVSASVADLILRYHAVLHAWCG